MSLRAPAVVLLLLLGVAVAGCLRSAPPPSSPPPVQMPPPADVNATLPEYKPPVARMQVFNADNTLSFESDFVAENKTTPAFVTGGANLTFSAANSAAVEPTATISSWRWSFGDGGFSSGRTVQHAYTDLGGMFTVTLTVTDSHQLSDALTVLLAVQPTRTFNVSYNRTGSLTLGTAGNGMQPGVDVATLPLNVSASVQGYPVQVSRARFVLHPGEATSDFDLYLKDPNGNTTASSATEPAPGADETLSLTGNDLKKPGTYTFQVVLYAGANGTFTLTGNVLYRVVNPNVPTPPEA